MSELEQAIEEMRNMRESYNQLAGAAVAYNEGKPALAAAISAKGVEASASDSLATMASKVQLISQQPIIWDDGVISQMYQKQMFGSLTTPNYWNLYEILAYLLSDNYTRQDTGHVGEPFGGFLLAEYYKGYNSLALNGADSGGAYVVSDIDPETGKFKVYYASQTHTWDTNDDGKGNRWVAYCFADEYHDFQITNTSTSPRSMFIGRKVGKIDFLTDGRTSEVVVPDGSFLKRFNCGGYSQSYGKKIIFRNLQEQNAQILNAPQGATYEAIYISSDDITNTLVKGNGNGITVSSCIIKANNIISYSTINQLLYSVGCQYLSIIAEKINITSYGLLHSGYGSYGTIILNVEDFPSARLVYSGNCGKLFIGYISNNKAKSVTILNGVSGSINLVELQNGYCKNINISDIVRSSMTEANIYTHILQRLKQDEPDCGDGVTITLGATNLAKLTSEESQALLAELRGTYGYTFA